MTKTTTGIKTIAVENFLSTLDGMTKSDALSNLRMGARLYKWNGPTYRAIEAGIIKHFTGR